MRCRKRRLSRSLPGTLAGVLALAMLVATGASATGWTKPERVTPRDGSSLSSLHELASTPAALHLVHGRTGPTVTDDRLAYQRSRTGGRSWSSERTVFAATRSWPHLVPNFAVAADGDLVALAWRVRGPEGASLFVRRSTNGGDSWKPRLRLATTRSQHGIGVPAVSVSGRTVIVGWTARADGTVRVRRSGDRGASFGERVILGRSELSITCTGDPLTDGLASLASSGDTVHLAWSKARQGDCLAGSIVVRTSTDDGRHWRAPREVTHRTSFGWPELAARGSRLLASVQRPDGGLVVARSTDRGRTFRERVIESRRHHALGAGDVLLPGGATAWLVYPDLAYDGRAVLSSRLLFRVSRDGGWTWHSARSVVPDAAKLRQAPNLGLSDGRPVIVFGSGPVSEARSDILVVRRS